MRFAVVLGVTLVLSVPMAGLANEGGGMDCAAQADLVMEAVNARAGGADKDETSKMLAEVLDLEAGAMLAEYIYALPPEQLTDAVGVAYKTQCEAL